MADVRRLVVKIGSRSILGGDRGDRPEAMRFQNVADQVGALRGLGYEVVVVSSGAVALGVQRLGLAERPTDLPGLQAAAAVGQCALIHAYELAFRTHAMTVAQMLLTHDGITDGRRSRNARAALDAVLAQGAVPIINENDTVATAEIEFGDNDQLAAMVANLVDADLLVLLTDVEGVLDQHRQRLSIAHDVEEVAALVWEDTGPRVSTGGMASKLAAAKRVQRAGRPAVIGPAMMDDVLLRLMRGEDVGTLFRPSPMVRGPARDRWIAEALPRRGTLVVDGPQVTRAGAGEHLGIRGVLSVQGEFRAGDAVTVTSETGEAVGCGLARFDARELRRLVRPADGPYGPASEEPVRDAVVRRDDFVRIV